MNIKEILSHSDHRPWPIPEKNWKFYQEWNDVIFLHWKVDQKELRKWIPDQLEIDLIEGEAWISMVAFSMERVRPRWAPAFAPISNFSEINIRAYVKYEGKAGVYFLSIEAANRLSSFLARSWSGLPYRYSRMRRGPNDYRSEHKSKGEYFKLKYSIKPGEKTKSELDIWLTERYALYNIEKGAVRCFEVHHVEWPIEELKIKELELSYPRFSSLVNNEVYQIHYSRGVGVICWD